MFGPARNEVVPTLPRGCTFPEARWTLLSRVWHPAAVAAEVRDRPLGTVLLDQRIVVWRTRSGLSAAHDLCIHRGSQLSQGTVKGEELVCPYHGFRYDPSGRCTLAPCTGSSETRLPAKLQLRSLATSEADGLLWVRLGAEGPKEPPKASLSVAGPIETAEWATSAQRATEYLLDPLPGPFSVFPGDSFAGSGRNPEAELTGPFSGFWSDRPAGRRLGSFAVQPISTARCRLFVSPGEAMAGTIAGALISARPIVESLPTDDRETGGTLLQEERTLAVYRERLASGGLS